MHSGYNGGVPLTVRDFQLRDFEFADFEELWKIDQKCFPAGISYSREELKAYMRRRGSFTLIAASAGSTSAAETDAGPRERNAEARGASDRGIAGFIVAEAVRGHGHIITIDVIPDARRFGVGSLLLTGAENRIRAAACRSVELETAVDNLSALSFYKRHGYSVIRTFPRYYSNGVDALVLQKSLVNGAGAR